MDKLPDIEQFAVDRLTPIEQFAVPAPIPASAPARPARAKAPEKSLAQTVLDPVQAFLRGTGQAASLGLAQYPAALGIQATRAVTGGAPLSFGEALQEVRQQNRQFQREYPTASTLGQLAGVATTLPVGVGGRLGMSTTPSLQNITGRGALYGGLQSATEAENIEQAKAEALKGALTGAVASNILGRTGMFAGRATTAYGEPIAIQEAKEYFKKDLGANIDAKKYLYNKPLSAKQATTPMTEKEIREYYKKAGKDTRIDINLAQNPSEAVRSGIRTGIREAIAPGVMTAGAGIGAAGAGGLLGVEDPLALAVLAGAGGLGAAKVSGFQAGARELAARLGERNLLMPRSTEALGGQVGEMAARALTTGVSPALGPYTPPPQTRLQQLADDFRQEYGGR